MHLRLGEQVLPICEIGPDFVTMDGAFEFPPCTAELWFSIDGREYERTVRLPNGISKESEQVEIAFAT
jgi:hypothetical protein